jgi:hypothetical protein
MINKRRMKTKKGSLILVLLVLFVSLGFISFVSASEECYNKIIIDERLVYDSFGNVSDVALSYIGRESIYGNYAGMVDEYITGFEDNYLLKVFSSSGNELGAYSFGTGLIIFYDNFGNETDFGGMEILDEGETSVIFPYFADASEIKVYFNGTEKFRQDISDIFGDLVCSGCVVQGGFGSKTSKVQSPESILGGDINGDGVIAEELLINQQCCEGLTSVFPNSFDLNSFVCTKCGDGICSQYEDYRSCWVDCKPIFNCSYGTISGKYGCVELNSCGNDILEVNIGEECDGEENCTADCYWRMEFNETNNQNIFTSCRDFDGSFSFSKSLSIKSIVVDGNQTHRDSCFDSNQLIENYCGFDLRFDFWNIKKIAKETIRECEYGCYDGKCYPKPPVIYLSGSIPGKDNETLSNLSDFELNLPPEPEKPNPF